MTCNIALEPSSDMNDEPLMVGDSASKSTWITIEAAGPTRAPTAAPPEAVVPETLIANTLPSWSPL